MQVWWDCTMAKANQKNMVQFSQHAWSTVQGEIWNPVGEDPEVSVEGE